MIFPSALSLLERSLFAFSQKIGFLLSNLFKDYGFKLYHKISFGYDYSRTLMEWKKNFNNNWEQISFNFDEKFKRLWNYYLDYCETGFSLDHTDVTQFYLKKSN